MLLVVLVYDFSFDVGCMLLLVVRLDWFGCDS